MTHRIGKQPNILEAMKESLERLAKHYYERFAFYQALADNINKVSAGDLGKIMKTAEKVIESEAKILEKIAKEKERKKPEVVKFT